MSATQIDITQGRRSNRRRNRFFHFLAELRRRQVCRAITMHAVAMWLVCQVVDVVSQPLGLPEWTLTLVIILGLLGLPIIVIMSWLLDITPDGLVLEGAARDRKAEVAESKPRGHLDQFIDCGLILVALAIGAQLALAAIGSQTAVADDHKQKIAVVQFRVGAGNGASGLSEALVIELQHALLRQPSIVVISPSDPDHLEGSLILAGAVSTDDTSVRVTVTVTENDSGVVAWSDVFERPLAATLSAPTVFAEAIVTALPLFNDAATIAELAYEGP